MVASLSCAELGTAQPQLVFMYSCSKSFRELKSAIKSVFPLFRGSGGQIKFFLSKKIRGRILVPVGKNIRSTCLFYRGHVFNKKKLEN